MSQPPENVNRATIMALVNCMIYLLIRLTPVIGDMSARQQIELLEDAKKFDQEQVRKSK